MEERELMIEEVRDLDAAWPELTLLFLELHSYHEPFLPRRLRDDWEQRWRDYVSLGDERLILLARAGSEAVGFLNACVRRSALLEETFGFIDDAYVREEARSQGLGRALLRRAEAWFRSRGAGEMRLNVVAANKLGARFWTLAGFELQSMTMRKSL